MCVYKTQYFSDRNFLQYLVSIYFTLSANVFGITIIFRMLLLFHFFLILQFFTFLIFKRSQAFSFLLCHKFSPFSRRNNTSIALLNFLFLLLLVCHHVQYIKKMIFCGNIIVRSISFETFSLIISIIHIFVSSFSESVINFLTLQR